MPWRKLEVILITCARSFGYKNDLEVHEGDTKLCFFDSEANLVESLNLTELAKELTNRGVTCK